MSSQFDPVTGLPMYVPPPLEQIPFKNPPYPWNDLTDNPVTPRTTYYGDDSIPTVSTIAGMHPTQPGGQTVNTDGNHALLVSDVGGGGGGNSPIKPTGWGFSMLHLPIPGGGGAGFGILPINTLYYMNWSLTAWDDPFAPSDPIDCKFYFEEFTGGGPNMAFAQFTAYLASATPADPFTVSGNVAFPFPIDLSFINGAVGYQLVFHASGDITGHVSASYVGTV